MKLLVVVDMQNDFITGALANEQAQKIIPNVVEKIKNYKDNDYEIVFTKDTHSKNYMLTEEGKNLPVPHCIENTPGWELESEILNVKPEHSLVLNKNTFGSNLFYDLIKSNGDDYESIEFVGVCTDICVISNAVLAKTASPNVHLILDASCCAGVSKEQHDAAIQTMKSLQVEIINEGKEPWR